jgi:hypothetical protein
MASTKKTIEDELCSRGIAPETINEVTSKIKEPPSPVIPVLLVIATTALICALIFIAVWERTSQGKDGPHAKIAQFGPGKFARGFGADDAGCASARRTVEASRSVNVLRDTRAHVRETRCRRQLERQTDVATTLQGSTRERTKARYQSPDAKHAYRAWL